MDAPEWAAIRCAGKARRRCGPLARKEEQRGQRAEVRLNRVCSALTQVVKAVVGKNPNKVKMMNAVGSGQLRFLGSMMDTPPEILFSQGNDQAQSKRVRRLAARGELRKLYAD